MFLFSANPLPSLLSECFVFTGFHDPIPLGFWRYTHPPVSLSEATTSRPPTSLRMLGPATRLPSGHQLHRNALYFAGIKSNFPSDSS